MKLSDYRETYYEFSQKTSDVNRSLSLAGIAVIWILKGEGPVGATIPNVLFAPLALFAISLGLDLLQYCVASIIWGAFHRFNERKLDNKNTDPELDASSKLTWPQNTFFVFKVLCVILGYILLITYLINLWSI